MRKKKKQKSPRFGGKLGKSIFNIALRWFGPSVTYFMLIFVIPYYVLIRKSARDSAYPYLSRRFPGQGPFKRLISTFRFFYQFGLVLIDQAAMGILGIERYEIDFPDEGKFYELAQKKRGIVLLTSHVGNWQVAMSSLGELKIPVHLIFKLDEQASDNHFFDLMNKRDQFHFIDPEGFLGGMVEAANVLKEGNCVATMGDRPFGAKTISTKFLGQDASFPLSPFQMAVTTGAYLVVLLTARTGKMSFHLDYEVISERFDLDNMSRDEAYQILLRCYVECLENYLDKYPYMWFNFIDLWNLESSKA